MRYNKIIDLLEHGKPVFSTSTVPKGPSPDNCFIHRVAVERMCNSTHHGSWQVEC